MLLLNFESISLLLTVCFSQKNRDPHYSSWYVATPEAQDIVGLVIRRSAPGDLLAATRELIWILLAPIGKKTLNSKHH
jgi:hypothetical protein